jgi:hypothetical protein
MIFGVIETENIIQVNDKVRISGVKSFVSKDEDAVSLVEIEPEAAAGFIDVTGTSAKDWYLDWSYSGVTRAVVVSLRITTGPVLTPTNVQTFTAQINVRTAVDDYLFSSDQDLINLEPDLLKWVPDGRSSFLNVHRAAQEKIMDWLNESGVEDVSGNKLTKAALVDLDEVRSWSRDLTLSLIFKGLQNAVDDIFSDKAKYYQSEALKRQARAKLRLDLNGDATVSLGESIDMTSRDLVRE